MSIKNRSSFTAKNASRYKRIFDTAIDTNSDIIIPLKSGMSPAAFQTRASDALKFLILYNDSEHTNTLGKLHTKGAYANLRGRIKLRLYEDNGGIKLRLTFTDRVTEVGGIEVVPSVSKEDQNKENISQGVDFPDLWKSRLIKDFIENPAYQTNGKIFKLKDLNLTDDDIGWANQILSNMPNCTFDVDTNIIIAMIKQQ